MEPSLPIRIGTRHQQGDRQMKTASKAALVLTGVIALAACNKQTPAENAAENVVENAENFQANMENAAEQVTNNAENKAEAMKNMGENAVESAKNEADAMKDAAKK
jgi:glutamate synthase domain-containing protein 2